MDSPNVLLVSVAFVILVVPFPDSDVILSGDKTIQRPGLAFRCRQSLSQQVGVQHIVTAIGLFIAFLHDARHAEHIAGDDLHSGIGDGLWHSALQVQSIGFFDQCHRHGLITRNARGGGAAEERGVLLHAFRIVGRTFLLVQPLCAGQIDVAARV